MIDLRSDTLTLPTPAMRERMSTAPVGDDVYAEDPSVLALQDAMATRSGKEAALFVPSGTMGNQICLALHTRSGDEVIAEADAHIFHYENAAASVLARVQIHPIDSDRGAMDIDRIVSAVRPNQYYYPRTSLIAVETSHNRHGGTVLPLDYLKDLRSCAQQLDVPVHCDGARLWNAAAALGVSLKELCTFFDTVSICLSKGAGAPVGSVIVGPRPLIEEARRWRKMLGGGMRQAGVLAAAALEGIESIVPRIPEDHRRARRFAEIVASDARVKIDMMRVQTNIVVFSVAGVNDEEFLHACLEEGVRIAPIRNGLMRAVWYHSVTDADTDRAASGVLAAVDRVSRVPI